MSVAGHEVFRISRTPARCADIELVDFVIEKGAVVAVGEAAPDGLGIGRVHIGMDIIGCDGVVGGVGIDKDVGSLERSGADLDREVFEAVGAEYLAVVGSVAPPLGGTILAGETISAVGYYAVIDAMIFLARCGIVVADVKLDVSLTLDVPDVNAAEAERTIVVGIFGQTDKIVLESYS